MGGAARLPPVRGAGLPVRAGNPGPGAACTGGAERSVYVSVCVCERLRRFAFASASLPRNVSGPTASPAAASSRRTAPTCPPWASRTSATCRCARCGSRSSLLSPSALSAHPAYARRAGQCPVYPGRALIQRECLSLSVCCFLAP